jgi:tetratricopeptide (TPR) repeat protein
VVGEKIPLFALSAGSSAMTVWAMKRGQVLRSLGQLTLTERLGNSLIGYGAYLRKMLWPDDLAPCYPLHPWRPLDLLAPAAALVLISILALWWARRHPALLVGWLWYLGTLVPVIGLVQVGAQAYADRFTYIPLIGLFVAGVWLAFDLAPARWRPGVGWAFVALLAASGTAAFWQVRIWRGSLPLWEHTLAVTEGNFIAHADLAAAYKEARRPEEARAQLRQAEAVCPDEPRAYAHLARMWVHQGPPEEAVACLEKAIRRHPAEPSLYETLGQVLRQLNRIAEAERWEAEAERQRP